MWQIVSGRSGSGKSICLQVLEDLGYYCIDNLPCQWLGHLIEDAHVLPAKLAMSIDARNFPVDFAFFARHWELLKQANIGCEVIYLDADTDALIRRFSETRRKHPLTNACTTLQEALVRERALLEPVSQIADWVIDTSKLTSAQLRELLVARLGSHHAGQLSLLFLSFGYKMGIPSDADYVFDVRCLSNPYWQANLRTLPGFAPMVMDFMQAQPQTEALFGHIVGFLDAYLPLFEAMNRSYLTVGLGCTGGQHRSVYMAHILGQHYQAIRNSVLVRHRDWAEVSCAQVAMRH